MSRYVSCPARVAAPADSGVLDGEAARWYMWATEATTDLLLGREDMEEVLEETEKSKGMMSSLMEAGLTSRVDTTNVVSRYMFER